MTVNIDTTAGALSDLLSEITTKLQLDDTRYERAGQSYRGVGGYLEAKTPPGVQLQIEPQGSMRLQTTVKPRGRVEYDLDIVAVLLGAALNTTPQQLYDWGLNLLAQHEFYKTILEPKNRCARLNYAGDFHLDVLFALLDPSPQTDATSILVPDRELQAFTRSNPAGFANWFERQCDVEVLVRKRFEVLAQAPLPSNDPAHLKALLKRIVQLIKRGRDMRFDGHGAAPRSVVLTTLAARNYLGAATLYDGLVSVMDRIVAEINSAHARGERLVVLNPTNELEDFSEAWEGNPDYRKSVAWIVEFRDRARALQQLKGPRLITELQTLFGEAVVQEAQLAVADRLRRATQAGQIRSTGRSLTAAGVGTVNPPHRFYGANDGGA